MKIKKKMRNLNGNRLDATRAEAAITLIAIASGELTESEFADWLRGHAGQRRPMTRTSDV